MALIAWVRLDLCLAGLVVPQFSPKLKFEPELLRTERKSGLRFEG